MPKSVVTLGTFDGVHRGHQRILSRVIQRAKNLGVRSAALIFSMPPRHAGQPHRKPVLLTTLEEKKAILRQLGLQDLYTLIFNRQTANTTAEDFFQKIVLRKCGAREMIVGPRVAFGKGRAGRLKQLAQFGKAADVRIESVSSVITRGGTVSSRKIRAFLEAGNVEKAEEMLGRPYSAQGRVVHGDHRGRKLGFPTANISVDTDKILPLGVYWVRVTDVRHPIPFSRSELRSSWDGLCNVGTRPTFRGDRERHCEVFLTKGPWRSFYGRHLRLVFLKRIRSERRFSSSQALQKQIQRDLVQAKRFKL